MTKYRNDLRVVSQWITPNSTLLDLGCGRGELMQSLRDNANVWSMGIEIEHDAINHCIKQGLNVIDQDLNLGLSQFDTQSFDTVVMAQTLQAVTAPDETLKEMLRIGKQCIVTIPNFGHWRPRLHLSIKGKMPVSKYMPFEWYNTPNIHFCTVRDFEILCQQLGYTILDRHYLTESGSSHSSITTKIWPNLFTETAIYRITK